MLDKHYDEWTRRETDKNENKCQRLVRFSHTPLGTSTKGERDHSKNHHVRYHANGRFFLFSYFPRDGEMNSRRIVGVADIAFESYGILIGY
ncbi:hypothetical protein Zmor_024877 [Zophobas morio]|uniref:Uncharacterized protein n=1 Tax=Zophobas morio TaxID=2755281 RepID=A0AA38HVR8_9CUCU|nr:hypothetical protein Zmor_024877 [Zophobas morio]